MGGAFGAGLMQGLGTSIKEGRDRQTQEEYKKALIEQSKLQTKMLENKLALAQHEQQIQAQLLRSKGIDIPSPPQVQLAASPAPTSAPRGPLQRLFGMGQQAAPQMTMPQPATTPVSQPLPAAQKPMAPTDQAWMDDYLNKKYFDLSPFREKMVLEKQMQQGEVYKYLDMGDAYLPMNRENRVVGPIIPKRVKPEYYTQEGPQGGEIRVPYHPYTGQPYQGGPQIQPTKPPGAGMTSDKAGKINLIGNALDRVREVDSLIRPQGKVNRDVLVKAMMPGGGLGQGAILYSKMYQSIDAALRVETGAQATPHEIQTKMHEFWPNPWDTDAAINSKLSDFTSYIQGAANTIDPTGALIKGRKGKPSLTSMSQKTQGGIVPPPPKGWRIVPGEKSPDGFPIVTDGKTKKRWGP